jgi:hypothetical protein
MLTDVTHIVTENDTKKALKRLWLVMAVKFINSAVKSSKSVLVKINGKRTTVKFHKALNFGRFLEFKNNKKNIIFTVCQT